MEIEFGGKYTQDQVRQAVRLLSRPRGWGWVRRLAGPMLFLFTLGLLGYAWISGEGVRPYSLVRAGTLLLLAGYYSASPYLSARRLEKQLWKVLDVQGAQRGIADGRGVAWQGLLYAGETGWEKFARIRADDTLLALITEEGTLHIFPRAFFHSAEDWERFRKLVQQRVKAIQ